MSVCICIKLTCILLRIRLKVYWIWGGRMKERAHGQQMKDEASHAKVYIVHRVPIMSFDGT